MANWQRTLNLKDIWPTNDPQRIASAIAERLLRLEPFSDPSLNRMRDEFAFEFGSMANDSNVDTDDFDDAMERLYDWADTRLDDVWDGKRVCWVQTF